MLLIIIRAIYAVVCAGAIVSLFQTEVFPPLLTRHPYITFTLLMLITQAVTLIDVLFPRKRLELISAIYFGLLIGTLLSYLLGVALQPVLTDSSIRQTTISLIVIALPYICISLLLQTKDDFRFVIPYVEFAKEIKGGRPLILDSSALIDGRIADFMETNVLDTELLVPSFILQEVQEIADSSDKIRRTRGRRGLDVLTKLQQNPKVDIRVYDVKDGDADGNSVDQRIVALAKRLTGRVVTNDFNLNKVASVQGVDVVNLNDVANSLKPRYLPGEMLRIKVIREGESIGQGVGYLDDGTMVVCEQASSMVGRDIDVAVTSVLQNSAGRMIFGRLASSAGGVHGRTSDPSIATR
ncbi:MAG: PIN/TRAM domain-containing protein [Planctomycetaceae bacterium]|nr:PIN/TRAM domain-containing protein [Planctomycetaceae bacterium]